MQTDSIADIIRTQAAQAPARRAFVEPGREWTFGELGDETNRIANGLIAAGVGEGDTVACQSGASSLPKTTRYDPESCCSSSCNVR